MPGLAIVSNDRGGEFTTTYGVTQSEFDSLLNDLVRRFNTPNTPKSGTSRIERVLGSLPKAARCSHFTCGLAPSFFFHAAVYAADTASSLPTKANVLGRGEAPDQALRLNYDLGVLVPFGTLGHHLVEGSKRDAKNKLVAILGLSHDGPGYRAIKVPRWRGDHVCAHQSSTCAWDGAVTDCQGGHRPYRTRSCFVA